MILKYLGREVEIEYSGAYEEPYATGGTYADGGFEILTDLELDDITNKFAAEISREIAEFAGMARFDAYKNRYRYNED